jgi:hypothetical protein
VDIEVDLFERLPEDRQRAIRRAAKRFGEFLGLEARVKPFAPTRGRRQLAGARE